jgi:hypothetical protein
MARELTSENILLIFTLLRSSLASVDLYSSIVDVP